MDTRDGRIYTPEQLRALLEAMEGNAQGEEERHFVRMEVPPTAEGRQERALPLR